jgi:hypothetical protein
MTTHRHELNLARAKDLTLALVANFNVPADKGDAVLTDDGLIQVLYRLGATVVTLGVRVTYEAGGRCTARFSVTTGEDLLKGGSSLFGLVTSLNDMEAHVSKVLRCVKVLPTE